MSNGDIYPDTGKTFSQELGERSILNLWQDMIALKDRLAAVRRIVDDNDQWIDCGARIALRHVLADSAPAAPKGYGERHGLIPTGSASLEQKP